MLTAPGIEPEWELVQARLSQGDCEGVTAKTLASFVSSGGEGSRPSRAATRERRKGTS